MGEFETLWRANLERGVLQIPRCSRCQTWNWYPLPACTHCQGRQFEWQSIAPVGRLYSWTRVHRSFVKADIALPYVVGLVELEGARAVRLPCRMAEADAFLPVIGERVALQPGGGVGGDGFWMFLPAAE